MNIRIGVIGYGEFTELVNSFRDNIPGGVELVVRNGIFEDAVRQAIEIDGDDGVDVILSAGSNGLAVRSRVQNPYVDVSVTGVDFLRALKRARASTGKVAVVTFQQRLPFLDLIAEMVDVRMAERVYHDEEELEEVLGELRDWGIRDVIGSTLVSERAREKGLEGHFIYSDDSIWGGILQAQNIAVARKKELEQNTKLKTILQFTREGIVATDTTGNITVFNDSAQRITGVPAERAVGSNVREVLQNTRLDKVIEQGSPELNEIQRIGGTHILTNRVPIVAKGEVIGALATFQTVDNISKAERSIRSKLLDRGLVAKNAIDDILGESACMTAAKEQARTFAATEATILICGETGTGKELFAQGIHNASARRGHPFVAVNCAAMPENLLESELFGYEEGAFTGAKKGGKSGVFELAHTGTIFLDEIGEISPGIQTRLLRVLEQKEVFRIGSERITAVDVRILAATNRDLRGMMREGRFREDLYYRLNVLKLRLPPLRERGGDVGLLFAKFLGAQRADLPPEVIRAAAAHPALGAHDWPGNIRELHNIAQRFAVLWQPGAAVDEVFARIGLQGRAETAADEREAIREALRACGGNKAAAARSLGIGRTTLWRRLRELGLEGEERPGEHD